MIYGGSYQEISSPFHVLSNEGDLTKSGWRCRWDIHAGGDNRVLYSVLAKVFGMIDGRYTQTMMMLFELPQCVYSMSFKVSKVRQTVVDGCHVIVQYLG